ncbi:Iron-binding protein IscA [Rickettsiales endosymbiont of Paramecium tredecaurelia]|uniref:HesB/IscA family protein n=1 Tax=Candidatus Sarmatiella mevalonica TaxID=2770581 RepID=UPI001921400D|nr:iron-sulfur cluster assembly accessory protein [Candidatus Sarmatiella mevalonica]MBL3284611.1 Iron-binding protein IscA [Candidatus Sarmatiella mevalonica]
MTLKTQKPQKPQKQIIELTDRALDQIRNLLAQKAAIGIKIGVKAGGCSGFTYYMEYAQSIDAIDEVVQVQEVKVIIDYKAMLYLVGCVMDYSETEFHAGFSFQNPNEKEKCGCGKSFNA